MDPVWSTLATSLASHGTLALALGFACKVLWSELKAARKELADYRDGRDQADKIERQRQDARIDKMHDASVDSTLKLAEAVQKSNKERA